MEHDQGRALAGMGAPPKAPGGAGWPGFGQSLAGCPVCGQALPQPGPCPNRWCRRADRGFSVVFAVGVHEGALRHAILRYKYRRETWWAGIFARLLADHLRTHATWFEEFDLLVPVPAYTGPRARRDWDPVGEIAGRLQRLVAPLWEIAAGAVEKREETPAMQGRPWADRQEIAAGPLRRSLVVPAPGRVSDARILVLDDVLTEGGTLREVAHVLRRAGRARSPGWSWPDRCGGPAGGWRRRAVVGGVGVRGAGVRRSGRATSGALARDLVVRPRRLICSRRLAGPKVFRCPRTWSECQCQTSGSRWPPGRVSRRAW